MGLEHILVEAHSSKRLGGSIACMVAWWPQVQHRLASGFILVRHWNRPIVPVGCR